MSDTLHVPLNRLSIWDGNVRKTDIHVGIDELAASIAAHGLLQSLVVRKTKRGKYDVVAGQRRFLALQSLAKDSIIGNDCAIPCILASDAFDAGEISLAENVVRAPMHPADQFEAFRAIIDGGASVAEVAARFGIPEAVVTKRLKLGRLSTVILDAYRKGDIDLDAAQAFAISDDHAAQERVLAELPDWNRDPDVIRSALTAEEIPTSDKRVRFIGVDAYREAGGIVRQDLFSDENTGYLQDSVLLDRLVHEKLSTEAGQVSAEGWCWVAIAPHADYSFLAGFKRLYPERAELADAEQAELDQLSAEYDALSDCDDADENRLQEIEQRIEALSGREVWPAETLAIAGAVVTLSYHGEPRVERGLVRKQDAHKLTATAGDAELEVSSEPRHLSLSPRLTEDLTAQQSAALGAELLSRPDVALASVVHALLIDAFYPGNDLSSCLKVFRSTPGLRSSMASPETSAGLTAIEQEGQRLRDRLPDSPQNLFHWLLERSRDDLLDLLAFAAATSIDGVQRKADHLASCRLDHAKILAQAVKLDMTRWFKPTAEGYFNRVNRAQILAAIDEATGSHAPSLEKLKKSELAVRAEQLLAATSWLPEPLRFAVNDNGDNQQSEAAE